MNKNIEKARQYAQEGVNFANQHILDKAIVSFKKSLEYVSSPHVHYLLGLAYQMIQKPSSAQKNYEKAIELDPQMSMAHNNMGAIYLSQKNYQKAVELFSTAASTDPSNAFAYNNLGNAYKYLGEVHKAAKNYRLAIKYNSILIEAYNNLGLIEFDQGKVNESIRLLNTAIKIDSNYAPCRFHLAIAYAKNDDITSAINQLGKYIAMVPNDDKALSLLANFYLTQKKYDNALITFKKTLAINPKYTFAINDLGNLYKETGNYEKAKHYYDLAIKNNPNLAGTYNNLGVINLDQGMYDEAIKYLQKALTLEPTMASAHYHLGLIHERQHKLDLAESDFKLAREYNSDMGQALTLLVYVLMQECGWKKLVEQIKLLEEQTDRELKEGKCPSESPFLNVIRKDDLPENQKIAVAHSNQIEKNIGEHTIYSFTPQKKKTLKIGYLSCDYFDHATSHLILGLFRNHDRSKFKVYAYSYGVDDGSVYRNKIENDCDQFRDINKTSYRESAEQIYKDQIDILVDLKGHTKNTRLEIAAHKPAPIQVSYLGFPGTTGAKFFDYFLTDKIVTPKSYEKYFAEKLVYLPNCYQINNNEREIANISYKKSDFDLPENAIVFCCFNHTYKIDPQTFKVWMKILTRVKNSVLWLMKSNAIAEKNLKKEAIKHGVNPERLIFAPFTPNTKHLARMKLADLALDTFICNGHTTTSDALWAGIPVVTLMGNHFASRVAGSILNAVGLPDLATETVIEYENLSVSLANNSQQLNRIKTYLDKNRLSCPLFDTLRFVENLEDAYSKMWDNYISGRNPKAIEVGN
jgi:protein O-GlcNAc transferase